MSLNDLCIELNIALENFKVQLKTNYVVKPCGSQPARDQLFCLTTPINTREVLQAPKQRPVYGHLVSHWFCK